MRIRIEIDNQTTEEEIVIKCRNMTEDISKIQQALAEVTDRKQIFIFYKKDVEYYLSLDEILFFETDENGISAHTAEDIYYVRYKLYELEKLLPRSFIRVSKSTILNTGHIHSMDHSLTSYSVVQFQGTHKQVYVSRRYYKALKETIQLLHSYL